MHHSDMRTHAAIVAAAGKPEDIAVSRSVSVHTVRSWMQRDSIPAEHWAGFADDGHASLEELALAAAARKVPAEAKAA
jgi:hypothetical protein